MQQLEKTVRNFFESTPASRSVLVLGDVYSQWVDSGEYNSNRDMEKANAAHEFTRVMGLITELEESVIIPDCKPFKVMKNSISTIDKSTSDKSTTGNATIGKDASEKRIGKTVLIKDSQMSLKEGKAILDAIARRLASRVRTYGENEAHAIWEFHLVIEAIYEQVFNRNDWKDAQSMVWALNTFGRPYKVVDFQPVSLTLEEYASQLIRGIIDTVAINTTWFTKEKQPMVFEKVELGLEEVADSLIKTRDYGIEELTEYLNLLNDIRSSLEPDLGTDEEVMLKNAA